MPSAFPIDIVIFGGGVAGLWLLDDLHRAGYRVLLLEAHELGSGQTIASQGIIHGGLKYSLSGLFTSSAKAVSQMPLIWRRCLAGEATPDLSGTRLRAAFCHLWRTDSIRSRLAMIGAKAGLRIAPVALEEHERPTVLAGCPGTVARLDEQVIEPASFIADLSRQHTGRILKIDAESGLEFALQQSGEIRLVRLINPETGEPVDLQPSVVVFAAGAGNAMLVTRAGLDAPAMQRRPLHMVMARSPVAENGDCSGLPVLNGHCVDGAATRLTITTTRDYDDRIIWQIGGQIAEVGVEFEPETLARRAADEVRAVLPGIDIAGVQWATYRVDRAEPQTRGGQRPEDAFAMRQGNVIVAWPTKLALAPRMSERVMELIGTKPQAANGGELRESANNHDVEDLRERRDSHGFRDFRGWPRPVIGLPPWETAKQWFSDL